jgi:hypothetical protein
MDLKISMNKFANMFGYRAVNNPKHNIVIIEGEI